MCTVFPLPFVYLQPLCLCTSPMYFPSHLSLRVLCFHYPMFISIPYVCVHPHVISIPFHFLLSISLCLLPSPLCMSPMSILTPPIHIHPISPRFVYFHPFFSFGYASSQPSSDSIFSSSIFTPLSLFLRQICF